MMIKTAKATAFRIVIFLMIFGCKDSPKVINATSDDVNSEGASGIFSEPSTTGSDSNSDINFNNPFPDELHKVTVNEVLPTEKYVYLNVNEGKEQFWIATGKADIKVGGTYYYKGGLLKTNFESKEYNRVFEKVYLVTSLVAENHGNNMGAVQRTNIDANEPTAIKEDIPTHTEKVIQHKGSMKIAELVNDPKKYEGSTVQISGICTKINAGIMERNWIHLKDGSKDDFDLVVTSNSFVPEGSSATFKAKVVLNKDFGAGYRYDIILEDGVLIK